MGVMTTLLWICVAIVLLIHVASFGLVRANRMKTETASFISGSLVNLVLLIVAVYSLHISLVALDESNKAGQEQNVANNQQLTALEASRQAILTTSSQQQATLDKSRGALEGQLIASRKQAQIIEKMLDTARQQQRLSAQELETMHAQTAVLQEQWKRANQAPLLAVFTVSLGNLGYVYLNLPPPPLISSIQTGSLSSGQPPYAIPFMIRNIGDVSVRKPKITASIEFPAHYECVYFRSYAVRSKNPCDLPPVELPDLLPDDGGHDVQNFKSRDLDQNFFVYFTTPKDAEGTTIHFTVSGDNLTAATYSMYVAFKK